MGPLPARILLTAIARRTEFHRAELVVFMARYIGDTRDRRRLHTSYPELSSASRAYELRTTAQTLDCLPRRFGADSIADVKSTGSARSSMHPSIPVADGSPSADVHGHSVNAPMRQA